MRRTSLGPARLSFDNVKKFSQIEREATRFGASRGQVLEYLRAANMYCQNVALLRQHPTQRELRGQMPPEHRLWKTRSEKFAADFCDRPTPERDYAVESLNLPAEDEFIQAVSLLLLDEGEMKSVGIPTATRLLLESNAPDAMQRSAQFLIVEQDGVGALPQTAHLPLPDSVQSEQARFDVQMLALDMVACRLRGGCGPSGFFTMYLCGPCIPGQGLLEMRRTGTTPEAYRYAQALAAAIESDRAAARRTR